MKKHDTPCGVSCFFLRRCRGADAGAESDACGEISRQRIPGRGAAKYTDIVRGVVAARSGSKGAGAGGMPGDARYMASREESEYLDLLDERNIARYNSEVQQVLDGTMPSGKTVLIGSTPRILVQHGAADGPMMIPQSAIKKAALAEGYGKGKHGLGEGVVYGLPAELADPMMITGNTSEHVKLGDNSIIVWTSWATKDGDRIIVPVRISVSATTGKLFNNVNTIFDVNDEKYRDDLLREGNVLYRKNNESIDQLLSQWREVPEARADDTLNQSITDSAEESNLRMKTLNEMVDEKFGKTKNEGTRYSIDDEWEAGEREYEERESAAREGHGKIYRYRARRGGGQERQQGRRRGRHAGRREVYERRE